METDGEPAGMPEGDADETVFFFEVEEWREPEYRDVPVEASKHITDRHPYMVHPDNGRRDGFAGSTVAARLV